MGGAAHNRGRSKQDYGTPDDFLEAVLRKFKLNYFDFDMACSESNMVECALQGVTEKMDALSLDWTTFEGNLWLNPPFDHLGKWMAKCNEVAARTNPDLYCSQLFGLVPAGVGSNWFRDWVHDVARVYFLNGRLKFKGAADYYPKDCLLLHFGVGATPGYDVWTWR